MSTTVKVDGSGRMVIPARLRRSLGLGDQGGIVVLDDGVDGVVMHPPRDDRDEPAADELGLIVLDPGRRVSQQEVTAAVEEDRDRRA